MGCDIHIRYEDVNGNSISFYNYADEGYTEEPFNWRCYSSFSFLAGVRNYSAIKPISEPRGFPADEENVNNDDEISFCGYGYQDCRYDDEHHSKSWLLISELSCYDYNQIIENRRTTLNGNGAHTCDVGEGEFMSLREFLGEFFMNSIKRCQDAGVHRIIFSFDN